ncbi:MAG TPA: hypothetical protein H9694_08260 [Firmicutes bacterium]|nr:hypothetical protein [Bacillota bacterium]
MAAYRSFQKCFQCGGVMLMDIKKQNSQAEYMHLYCSRCGHSTSVIRRPGENNTKFTLEIEDHFGYGSMSFVYKSGRTYLCPLIEPYSAEIKQYFEMAIQPNEIDTTKCHLTRWDEASKQVVTICGPVLPLYEEWEKQQNATND